MLRYMDTIPDDIILRIAAKLYNEDIINLSIVSKRFNKILTEEDFKDYLLTRKHPVVFNNFDRFCNVCNFSPILWDDMKIKYIHCKHE